MADNPMDHSLKMPDKVEQSAIGGQANFATDFNPFGGPPLKPETFRAIAGDASAEKKPFWKRLLSGL